MKQWGVLCPVISLPSEYGIGDFGKSSFEFIDFLKEQKLNIWQVLPLNDANIWNCPYGAKAFLTFDWQFADVESLVENCLLKEEDLKTLKKLKNSKQINYGVIKPEKKRLLKKAYEVFSIKHIKILKDFAKRRIDIYEYAIYQALLSHFNVEDWRKLEKCYYDINSKECKNFAKKQENLVFYYVFEQYVLINQWLKVKNYAKEKGIIILGDTPIYCERNSFDVYRNPQYFKLDENYLPTVTGGVPPDEFCEDGQDWGTCIYNWKELKKDEFKWWKYRFNTMFTYFDIIRLDHIMGYVEHFENNVSDKKKSKWVKEGGLNFFDSIKDEVDLSRFVIEDLGIISEDCRKLQKKYSFKGMNIMQFAFSDEKNRYLPENVEKNSIYYLGTHDNNTYIGFLNSLSKQEIEKVKRLLKIRAKNNKQILIESVRRMAESDSDTIILQIQDFLLEDEKARMNVPGRAEDCYLYRMPKNYKKTFRKVWSKIKA